MQPVTIKIVNGPRRGITLENLSPPITIGREEGNDIQLNDDRMSRCHARIQRDNERHVLIDLDSTNGTKVNGRSCHVHVLRYGDVITVGRSTLWFGTGRQIAERLCNLEPQQEGASSSPAWLGSEAAIADLPPLPDGLTPGQRAELAEAVDFFHCHIQQLIDTAEIDERNHDVRLNPSAWRRLIAWQQRVAKLTGTVADPHLSR